MAIIGTSHFLNIDAALKYYRPYGEDLEGVNTKLREGEIFLGIPHTKPGETYTLRDGRYMIIEPSISTETIKAIRDAGFTVYMRDRSSSYLLFTDGINIGYMENDRLEGLRLSTVHKPNTTTGTAFGELGWTGEFTKEALSVAFIIAPSWAMEHQRKASIKYKDMAAYLAAPLNKGYAPIDA